MNVGNKTWNTGCWKRKLVTIATSKKLPFAANPKSQASAQYILDRRDNKTKTPKPSSGLGFFPFEEQLYHLTREVLVLASSGIGASFFQNPYVRDYLQALQSHHRPIYRLKLVRLIQCIIDTSQHVVCILSFFNNYCPRHA